MKNRHEVRSLEKVEESLRIATQIIRDHGLDVDLEAELSQARNGTSQKYQLLSEEETARESVKRPRPTSGQDKEGRDSPASQSLGVDYAIPEPCLELLVSTENAVEAISADLLPAANVEDTVISGADYDWDERNTEAQSCIDGMAALSIQEERPGYLGLASGAALLHLIQSCSGPVSSTAAQNVPSSKAQSPQPLAVNLQRNIPAHRIEAYVANYFNEYHTSYPLIHQGLFMAQYHEIVSRPKYGWNVLMYIMAAIGAFMSATAPNDDDLVLYHKARSHLSIEILEVGSLTLVQSLSLISNYLQKRDRPNSSHNYLGLAVRMAYGLGLHKDHPSIDGNLLYREIRRRTWWCLYIFDAGSTITFSRPLAIPSAGLDSKLPLNISESDLTVSAVAAPDSINAPTIYTNVRVQSQFHLLTNHIYNRIISKPSPSAKQVLEWDDKYIEKWLDLVPDYYKENAEVPQRHALAHAIMTWRYKHFRMIIYRPYLIQKALMSTWTQSPPRGQWSLGTTHQSSSFYIDSACERCLKESHDTITSVHFFWENNIHTRMACWYALYFLFSATLVPIIILRNEPLSSLAKAWQEDIEKAIDVIKGMVELSPYASRCVETLETISNNYTGDGDSTNIPQFPDIPGFSDSMDQIPFAQMFSSNPAGLFEAPEIFFEEQMW
ncbi:hypothetical protein N7462_007114 [Penicillium macrosclerotiorum]|uniref:uncharacterized protein n=1 Tax=Penicillium macrosclerotiorum TaxID=303699 RepID=UPI002547E7F0|nr:uncharacterized protein N7462_007114 [Penicillium macrosclerotiorum]KAJ5678870.1 hypothetical protein N7462_007114 [Penicillium macrosclerotiorum]